MLLHFHYFCSGELPIAFIHRFHQIVGQCGKSHAGDAVGIQCYGAPLVAAFADALHNGYLSQQGISLFFGQLLASFFSENIIFVLR